MPRAETLSLIKESIRDMAESGLSLSKIAEPQTHLYLPHRLVVDITIDGPTTTTTRPDSRDSHLNL